jgi:acyl dehydratase
VAEQGPLAIGATLKVTGPITVSDQDVRRFCELLGETNPLFLEEEAARRGPYGQLVAPPSFAVTFRDVGHFADELFRLGKLGFDAGKDIEFVRPIRPGDQITATSRVARIYEKTGRSGPMVFVVVRSTLTNQRGEIVAHVDHRFTALAEFPAEEIAPGSGRDRQ